ncbi:hypothetical protein [Nonomuraea sp. NPDC003709]|uniref:hypothetical protein n=1 Tax=Nonomuraea sp. NPDC003709 TaxID=3154450 RepID=UPI0033AB61A3
MRSPLNVREVIEHYDSVLTVDEWILWNPVTWMVAEPFGGPWSLQEIGNKVSGEHDFHVEGIHVKEGMEDEDNPHLFIDFQGDAFFLFDTYDITDRHGRLQRLLGDDSLVWSVHFAGPARYTFNYLVNGQTQMSTNDILREDTLGVGVPLADDIEELRVAWRAQPGKYLSSAALTIMSTASGVTLSSEWLDSVQRTLVTENFP